MSKHKINHAGQLGFDALLSAADTDNRKRRFDQDTAHLPSAMEEALAYYRVMIGQHHAAMLAADEAKVMEFREQARLLALRVNDGKPGIIADDDAPGCVLERRTAAPIGTVPKWGQCGEFVIEVNGMRVRIDLDGLFGIGAGACYWPGFAAYAVDFDKPFLSETGYRSFLGIYADPAPGLLPDEFAAKVVSAHIERELKGKPVAIAQRYRRRAAA